MKLNDQDNGADLMRSFEEGHAMNPVERYVELKGSERKIPAGARYVGP